MSAEGPKISRIWNIFSLLIALVLVSSNEIYEFHFLDTRYFAAILTKVLLKFYLNVCITNTSKSKHKRCKGEI